MKKLLAIFGFLLSVSAFASEKYVVILNNPSSIQTVNHLKTDTLASMTRMNSAVSETVFRPYVDMGVLADKVLWVVHGFSATLDDDQYAAIMNSGEVQSIEKVRTFYLPKLTPEAASSTWGLDKVKVTALRKAHPEADGAGIVVGVLDSGVDGTHPDLVGKVIGWKDFVAQKATPYDDNNHGTHTSGTIAGGNTSGTAIGVAPGVKLIEGKIFGPDGSATSDVILDAMGWMAEQKVSLVSNSWGGAQGDTNLTADSMYQACQTWRANGIIPVFAAGNDGPDAGSVGIPGGYPNVIGVGAIDSKSAIASFSSRGPIKWVVGKDTTSYDKPEVVAPGVDVLSSVPGGKYDTYSGTSMATPHVAGVLALILQSHPGLSYDDALKLLTDTATSLGAKNTFGAGLVNAQKAYLKK